MTKHTDPPLRIVSTDEVRQGVYANLGLISHRREEFIFDFLLMPPVNENAAVLVSRVILSPAHFKRLYKAMNEQITKYEDSYGKITQPLELK